MLDFHTSFEFEKVLVDVANSVLLNEGITSSRQRIGGGTSSLELDYVFTPKNFGPRDRMYIFEFKYSSSPTLADSAVNLQLARFDALKKANTQRSIRFLLVTNGQAFNVTLPRDVTIIDNVRNSKEWRRRLESWLQSERSRQDYLDS